MEENTITRDIPTDEEIVAALNTIKAVCETTNDCDTCIFSKGSDCLIIENSPDVWLIQSKPIKKFML